MTIPDVPDKLVCTPTILRKDGETITFRRLTGAGEPRNSVWSHFIGDHKGVVVERLHNFLFSAVNQGGLNEPTLLRLRWSPISVPTLVGTGMILTQTGASIVIVLMRMAPIGTTLRDAVRNSRVFSKTDPFVNASILQALEQQRKELVMGINAL